MSADLRAAILQAIADVRRQFYAMPFSGDIAIDRIERRVVDILTPHLDRPHKLEK